MARAAEVETAPAGRPLPGVRRRAGWRVVAAKELADHMSSVRFFVLVLLLGVAAIGTVYSASGVIQDAAPVANELPALFLRLFTVTSDRLPSFFTTVGLVAFLTPLLGIAFGFDAVSGERSQGTLPRLVAQPIHRDDVINGKFVAGLAIIGLMLGALALMVAGLGLVRLGIVPTAEETGRLVLWLVLTMLYVSFWLGLATLCSVAFSRAATSALVLITAWLVLALFWGLLTQLLADGLAPRPDVGPFLGPAEFEEALRNVRLEEGIGRLSPARLYEEAGKAVLRPEVRSLSFTLPQFGQAEESTLPLDQSLLVAWPQIVLLVAMTVGVFAAAYVLFMRQEVRA